MPALEQDFTLYQGSILTVEVTVLDKDTTGDPPLDLTSKTVTWGASRVLPNGSFSPDLVLSKSTADSTLTITDAVNGLVEFTITTEESLALLLCNYRHEMIVETSAIDVTEVMIGTMKVKRTLKLGAP